MQGHGRFGHLGLHRMTRLLALLSHPEQGMAFWHVAGTNGKGSAVAVLERVLQEMGLRVGAFISPPLGEERERIRIDGQPASREAVARAVHVLRPLEDAFPPEDPPTEFELWTAAALLVFREAGVQAVAWETGLGGRLDATTAVPTVRAAAITSVSWDHMDRLGPTLAHIAREKAGILRPGRPGVVGRLPAEALAVVEEVAAERQVPLWRPGREWDLEVLEVGLEGTAFRLRLGDRVLEDLRVSLLGRHQADNAAVAVACLHAGGLEVPPEVLRRALGSVRWPGRLEWAGESPRILLDGAHNPGGTAALAQALADLRLRGAVLVYGMLSDRDPRACLEPLLPAVSGVVVTQPPVSRALPAVALAEAVPPGLRLATVADVREALALARQAAGREGTVVVAGSLYLLGAVRRLLAGSHPPEGGETGER